MTCHDDVSHAGPVERPRYFEGQLLTAEDFTAEQDYWVRNQRRHNVALHGWGIVCGLEVATRDGSVVISPGIALDSLGREIVVSEPVEVECATQEGEGEVVLRYRETPSRWSASGEASRIVEGFQVLVQCGNARRRRKGVVLAKLHRSTDNGVTVAQNDRPVSIRQVLEALNGLVDRVATLEEQIARLGEREISG